MIPNCKKNELKIITNLYQIIPSHIFLNWKHEYIQLQVLDNIPTGSTLHIDLTYFL